MTTAERFRKWLVTPFISGKTALVGSVVIATFLSLFGYLAGGWIGPFMGIGWFAGVWVMLLRPVMRDRQ